ncbi:MAG: hypothetical protein AAF657_12850 [Acidobacteriota bacterium]
MPTNRRRSTLLFLAFCYILTLGTSAGFAQTMSCHESSEDWTVPCPPAEDLFDMRYQVDFRPVSGPRKMTLSGIEFVAAIFENQAFQCGFEGNANALLLEVCDDGICEEFSSETKALWVLLHPGGGGYFDVDSTPEHPIYQKGSPLAPTSGTIENSQKSPGYLQGVFSDHLQTDPVQSNPLIQQLVDRTYVLAGQGVRFLVPATCDHDIHAGVGTIYPRKPVSVDGWSSDTTVDGLLADLSAIDFIANPVHGSGIATSLVVLHGTSAGAYGAFAIAATLHKVEGRDVNAVIADSSLASERFDHLFHQTDQPDCTRGQLSNPELDLCRLEEKIGHFFCNPNLFPESAVRSGFDIPYFDIASGNDQRCCGGSPAISAALDDDGYPDTEPNNCEWMHNGLRQALALKPLQQSITYAACSPLQEDDCPNGQYHDHVVTKRPGPWNDDLIRWLDASIDDTTLGPWE